MDVEIAYYDKETKKFTIKFSNTELIKTVYRLSLKFSFENEAKF